jgi:hypothetical protein
MLKLTKYQRVVAMYNNEMIRFESMWMMGPFGALFMAVLVVVPFWFIFGKAGFSNWLSLLVLVPVVNIVLLYFLAFSDWPALKKSDSV